MKYHIQRLIIPPFETMIYVWHCEGQVNLVQDAAEESVTFLNADKEDPTWIEGIKISQIQ